MYRQILSEYLTPPQQRWWYPVLAAKKSLPTTIQTGTELQVLDEHDVKAGAVIEYSQAIDKAEGPVTVDPSEGRAFILSNKGEHYLQTIKPGASTMEVASALGTAQREI